jgi:hypothetical protein
MTGLRAETSALRDGLRAERATLRGEMHAMDERLTIALDLRERIAALEARFRN